MIRSTGSTSIVDGQRRSYFLKGIVWDRHVAQLHGATQTALRRRLQRFESVANRRIGESANLRAGMSESCAFVKIDKVLGTSCISSLSSPTCGHVGDVSLHAGLAEYAGALWP